MLKVDSPPGLFTDKGARSSNLAHLRNGEKNYENKHELTFFESLAASAVEEKTMVDS